VTEQTVYGTDRSHFDEPLGSMDLGAVRALGIDFITHKVAEGHHFYRDAMFGEFATRAAAAGFPIIGSYFVNHPGTVEDQADWWVQLVTAAAPWWRKHPCFIWQIDAEQFGYMSRAPSPAEIQALGDRLVHTHGIDPRRVLAYAPQWLYHGTLGALTYRLWASNYGTNPAVPFRAAYPGNTSSRWAPYSPGQAPPLLLQDGSRTIMEKPGCDADAYRGTLAQLLADLGAAPTPQPPREDEDMPLMLARDNAGNTYVCNAMISRGPLSQREIVDICSLWSGHLDRGAPDDEAWTTGPDGTPCIRLGWYPGAYGTQPPTPIPIGPGGAFTFTGTATPAQAPGA
jgi:glycosyl hydrolase family 25